MQFSCDKDTIFNGLNIVSKAISSHTTNKTLEGILIEATGDGLILTCTDLSLGIITKVNAEIIEEGIALVPGKIFVEFTKKLPDGKVTFSFYDNNVKIDYGISSTVLQTLNPETYPQIPEVNEDKGIIIKEDKLSNMINSSLFSVAVEDSRPVLTGAYFEIIEDAAKLVCLDGYRMAIYEEKLGSSYDNVGVIVPASTLSEVQKLLLGNESITIYVNSSHILFNIRDTKIVSRLIEGEYINYNRIIPSDHESIITLNVMEFADTLDRVSTLSREDGNNLVKMKIEEHSVKVSTKSTLGNINEEININLDGKELEIAFNVKYITDILKHIDKDINNVSMYMNTSSTPCVIKSSDNSSFVYMILPIRMY